MKRARSLRLVLCGVALGCAPALFAAWRAGYPGKERAEIAFELALSGLGLALLGIAALTDLERGGRRWRRIALVAFACLSALAYYNFGRFHGRGFVHHWEQFHYALNAKYFEELGHDGLYVASLEAELVTRPRVALQPFVRDLRTDEVVSTISPGLVEHRAEVRARFTDERWAAFVADHREFVTSSSGTYLARIRKDHGFNAPPSWTFVARLFARDTLLDRRALIRFGCIDVALLALLFAGIVWAFGLETGCFALAIFGLGYAGRFHWVGGAFLREDWLAALGLGVCLLHRGHARSAGALIAYSAMVRVFPLLFLFGPAVVAARQIVRGEDWGQARRFALGFGASALALFAAGCLAGRGLDGWLEFVDTIRLHERTWLTNNVGLANVLLYGPDDFLRTRVDFELPEPWIHWQAHMDGVRAARAPLVWAVRVAFLALLARACWRARPAEAAVLSLGCVFALTLSTCYYWQALLLLALLGSPAVSCAVLVLNLGQQALHFASGSFELRYGLMSWGLLAFFVALYVIRVRSDVRRA